METIVNKAVKVNKWVNIRVIQQSFGYGWEDVDTLMIYDDYKYLVKEYRLLGYPTRVIVRRVINVLWSVDNKI